MTTTAFASLPACSLGPEVAAGRADEFRALLRPRLRRLTRDAGAAVLDLEMGRGPEARLRDLLRAEHECCPFWRFGVERRSGRRVRLRVSAEPPSPDVVDAFVSLAAAEGADDATFRSGEAARRAGVGVETLRYYERRGLLPRPQRRPSGQREYTEADVRLVRAIRTAQRLGFTLDESRGIVAATRSGEPRDPGALRGMAEAKLAEVEERIRGLELLRSELRAVIAADCDRLVGCDCGDCPIDEAASAPSPRLLQVRR